MSAVGARMIGSLANEGLSLVLATVIRSVLVTVAVPSVAETVKVLRPTWSFAGVPDKSGRADICTPVAR